MLTPRRQDETAGDAQQIAKTLQKAQILHPKARKIIQIPQIESHQDSEADVWRRPHRPDPRVGEKDGVQTVGTEEDRQQGRGGLLFVGIQTEPDPAIVG